MSIGLASRSPRQRTSLTSGWKLLGQGPQSQLASLICCGGVSAVIGSSDLDGHTFHSAAVHGYPSNAHCLMGKTAECVDEVPVPAGGYSDPPSSAADHLWKVPSFKKSRCLQFILSSLFHLSRDSTEKTGGQKKPGHHTRLMRRFTSRSASDQNARGCINTVQTITLIMR